MKTFHSITFIIFLSIGIVFSNNVIDSLEKRIEIANTIEKASLLNQLSNVYLKTNPSKSLELAIDAESFAHKTHDLLNEGLSFKNQALSYQALERYSEAILYANNTLEFYTKQSDYKLIAETNNLKGLIFKDRNEYEQSLICYNKALDIFKQLNDYSGQATTLNFIGSLYYKQTNYNQALSFYHNALKIRIEKNETELLPFSYYNIALVLRDQGKFQEAILTLDAANSILNKYSNIELQANTLNLIGSIYLKLHKFQKAEEMFNLALVLRTKFGLQSDIASSYINLGQLNKETNNETNSLKYFHKALEIYKQIDNKKGYVSTLNYIGGMYFKSKKYSDALQYYLESLLKSVENEDKSQSLSAQINIGNIYSETGNFEKAYEYYSNAKTHCIELKDNLKLATVLNQMGNVLSKMLKYDDAIENFEISLRLREQIGDQSAVAATLNNIGGVYSDMHNFSNALNYYSKALQIRKIIDDKSGISTSLNNIGNIYLLEKKYNTALNYFLQALTIADSIDFQFNIGLCSRKIGEIHIKTNQAEKAPNYFKKSIECGKKLNNFELLRKGYENLYLYYHSKNDCKNSLEIYRLFIAYDDSVTYSLNNKKITELQVNFELKQHENEIKQIEFEITSLQNEQKVKDLKLSRQKYIIILFLVTSILVLLLVILYYNRFKTKKRAEKALQEKVEIIENTNTELKASKEELVKLNNTKDKFFSIIAHDIKNPLGGIINFTELLMTDYRNIPDDELSEMFKQLNKSSSELYNLLENLLHWSRAQLGRVPFNPQLVNLHLLINSNFNLLQINANKKQLSLLNQVKPNNEVFADSDMLTLIIRNILANAIKYTPIGGKIVVNSINIGNLTEISIADNGVGMSTEEISKLFKIESQFTKPGTNNEAGTGLGLLLCQEFVLKNNGKIRVESNLGQGSRFIFTLPNNKS